MQVIKGLSPNVDNLAENLAAWGRMGKALPPSWDGAKHTIPMNGPQKEPIGQIMPGRGFFLNQDLKTLGITRGHIPHVFERTAVKKIAEAFDSERLAIKLIAARNEVLHYGYIAPPSPRAAITTYDGIIAARAGGYANDITVIKASLTTVATTWYSLMNAAAGNVTTLTGSLAAGSGSANAGGTICTNATAGAWSLGLSNPTTGQNKYLLTVGFTTAQQLQMACLVDILVGASGLSTNSATNNVNTRNLTRYCATAGSSPLQDNTAGRPPAGAGVWPVLEITTAPTAGAQNMGGTYNNQAAAGANFVATAAFSAAPAGRIQANANGVPFPYPQLAVGDYGVQNITTITTSAQLTTGVFNAYLVYPLMMIPGLAAGIYVERDSTIQIDGLTQLANDSSLVLGCLGVFVLANTTSTGVAMYFLRTCAG